MLLEIATDKVDSEIPSPVAGRVDKILYKQEDLVAVGEIIAIINTDPQAESDTQAESDSQADSKPEVDEKEVLQESDDQKASVEETSTSNNSDSRSEPPNTQKERTGRFYSPLVRSIAKQEGVTHEELNSIEGSGKNGRVNKSDMLTYLEGRDNAISTEADQKASGEESQKPSSHRVHPSTDASDTIVAMDRTRKLIAEHMVRSKNTSVHVTNMVEADVTELVKWRERMKETYVSRYKVKLTYMPIFTEATARALRDFPMMNSSVDGDNIIVRGRVNIGIAVARPDGNLIVPVVHDADQLNILGLANSINTLAAEARENKLSPDSIQGGTFSITNFGTFRNLMGTPIIAQPQVAILATGSIEKKPAVVETEHGDIIVPRHKMFLSLSYDHRIIDGALGGAFLRRVADYLEGFDANREV